MAKKRPPMVHFTLRVPAADRDELADLADKLDLPIGEVVRDAIKHYAPELRKQLAERRKPALAL